MPVCEACGQKMPAKSERSAPRNRATVPGLWDQLSEVEQRALVFAKSDAQNLLFSSAGFKPKHLANAVVALVTLVDNKPRSRQGMARHAERLASAASYVWHQAVELDADFRTGQQSRRLAESARKAAAAAERLIKAPPEN